MPKNSFTESSMVIMLEHQEASHVCNGLKGSAGLVFELRAVF